MISVAFPIMDYFVGLIMGRLRCLKWGTNTHLPQVEWADVSLPDLTFTSILSHAQYESSAGELGLDGLWQPAADKVVICLIMGRVIAGPPWVFSPPGLLSGPCQTFLFCFTNP